MPGTINTAAIFVIKTLSNLVLIVFVLRLMLQWVRMDFHNPVAQFVFRTTNPLVAPLQRLVPRSRFIDLPGAIILLVVTAAVNFLLLGLQNFPWTPLSFTYFVVARIIHLTTLIYIVCIIVSAVLSWFAPGGYNPLIGALHAIVNPLLSRFRRFLPPFEGIDFSPLAAIICLYVVRILLPLPYVLL